MDRILGLLNRCVTLYFGLAAVCAVLIDPAAARIKILNFDRNAAREVNRFALRPDVPFDDEVFYQAAAYHRGLVRLLPDQTLSYGALGYIQAQRQSFRKAARAFEKAAAHHPDLFGFHFNRGLVYYQLGDTARARAALRQAINTPPAPSVAHDRLIAGRMFRDPKLREAWLAERVYRLKSAHEFAGRLLSAIDSGQRVVVNSGQYFYYVPPVETGVIPLQSLVGGTNSP